MLNLLYLKYFYDAVRLGTVSGSARANFVTQPAVSQGIRRLEKELGHALITHCRNQLKLTPEGERVFDECRRVFRAVEQLESSLDNGGRELGGELLFGCAQSFASSVLYEPLFELRRSATQVQPIVMLGHTGLVKQWLRRGDIEFGIALDNEDLSPYDTELLYEGQFRVFCSVNRDRSEAITKCILTRPQRESRSLQRFYEQRFGRRLITDIEIDSWGLIADLVVNNVGVGFFPDYLALHPERQKRIIPCDLGLPPIPYRLFVTYPAREELSAPAKHFIRALKQAMQSAQLRTHEAFSVLQN